MSTNKKHLIYVYVAVFIVVIIVSSLTTVYISQSNESFFSGSKDGTEGNSSNTRFGKFDGHDACVKEIHRITDGTVIGLVSDDRTAKYESYNNTNQIVFQGEIQPPKTSFLSEQRSTHHASFKCSSSAKTNKVVNINVEKVDNLNLN